MSEPGNNLERSLAKAATDVSHRPQFYRDLIASDVYVISDGPLPLDIRDGVIQPGEKIAMRHIPRDGTNWLPMFSSLQRLQQFVQRESKYVRMKSKDFFDLTGGAHVVLNPGLDFGKEFLPDEIAGILDGSIFEKVHAIRIEKDTRVLLGQPAIYPTKLVSDLSKLFTRHKGVIAAYLGQIAWPDPSKPPNLVIGVDAATGWDDVRQDLGLVLSELTKTGETVDVVQISQRSAVSDYLARETKPFYRRSRIWRLFK